MKKSKLEILNFFVLSFLIMYFLLPLEINNNIVGQDVYALEVKDMTLKEKRNSYFAGDNSIFRTNKNIKVLIVPGHDDDYWGTEHDGVKEVELNRELALNLYDFLRKESGFSVAITSDENGYTRTFKNFFEKYEDSIKDFIDDSKKDFDKKIKKGKVELKGTDYHNSAPEEVAKRLYGINMWANQNEFDLVLHVHFNDYGGRWDDKKPKYNGFAIYIPEGQLENHEVSFEFAENIKERLSEISATSNLKQEVGGVVETQQLIAIGSNDTLNVPAVLIEYGYVYEPQFTNPDTRPRVLSDLAFQTYKGIKDYFGEVAMEDEEYVHAKDLEKKENVWSEENYMLQKELAQSGFYPPKNKTLNDCPVAGYFGSCTEDAVKLFQKKNNLPATGFVGPLTRQILNSL